FTPPTPTAWTLRLKHHRTTLLFHTDPLQTFATLKTQLLTALRETCPGEALDGTPLPSSPSEIILARPVDINDLSKGFVTGEWERDGFGDEDMEDVEESGVGKKGKGRPKKVTQVAGDCPKGARNVKDGGVLAFSWGKERDRREGKGKRRVEVNEDGEAQEEWDVVLPSYEDSYG
ncbi:hypothetical protein BU16DRAFT_441395, partial [Lophium mytilinum]